MYDKESVFQVKTSMGKDKNKLVNYHVLLDEENLVFCLNDLSKSEALNVRYKYRIIYIEALIEKSDPKIIHLRAKDNNGIIYFDCHLNDSKNSLSFKEKIDKVRRDLKDKETIKLISFLEKLIDK